MRKQILVLCVFCVVLLGHKNQDGSLRAYRSEKLGFEVSFPENWKVVSDEDNNYIGLYSPESFNHVTETADLISGLKIEIMTQSKEDLADLFKQNQLRQVGRANQFYIRDPDCYYRYAIIESENWQVLIVGYFPELKKEAFYLPLYQQVVGSFKPL